RHTRWPRDWSSDVCSSDLRPHGRAGFDPPLDPQIHLSGRLYSGTFGGPPAGRAIEAVDHRYRDPAPALRRDAEIMAPPIRAEPQIGRASCRERMEIAGVGG